MTGLVVHCSGRPVKITSPPLTILLETFFFCDDFFLFFRNAAPQPSKNNIHVFICFILPFMRLAGKFALAASDYLRCVMQYWSRFAYLHFAPLKKCIAVLQCLQRCVHIPAGWFLLPGDKEKPYVSTLACRVVFSFVR